MNIVDPIAIHCRYQPEALAICAPGSDLITYDRLDKVVNNISKRVASEGLASGQVVAISVSQPIFHAALIIALARLGVISASPGTGKLPQGLHVDAIISDRGAPVFPGYRTVLADPSWTSGDGRPAASKYVAKGSDICRIIFTSGTTGEAKGVAVTHDMILTRLLRYNSIFGSLVPRCSRVFCDLAWGTALGFQMFLYTLGRGGAFFVRGNTPENTLRAFEFYRVDHLVASPAGLADFATEYDRHKCRHPIDIIQFAGGALSKSLAARVRSRIGSTLVCDYGSAETSCAAAAPLSAIENISGAVGYVTPGTIVEIVGDDGHVLSTGQEGFVRIRGDCVVTEYVDDAEASKQFFQDGWFYPGDLGSVTPDGLLIISGRRTSVMNLGGEKIKPEIIEDVLAAFADGMEGAAVAMVNPFGLEEVWAAIASSQPIEEDRLREHCQNRLAGIFVPKKFIVIDRLPRNEMGKLDRQKVAQIIKGTLRA